jgi:hypothetical protein
VLIAVCASIASIIASVIPLIGIAEALYQLRLEQRFDDCGTVDRYERPVAPGIELVNMAPDQLFAGSALAPYRAVVERDSWLSTCSRTSLGRVGGVAITVVRSRTKKALRCGRFE